MSASSVLSYGCAPSDAAELSKPSGNQFCKSNKPGSSTAGTTVTGASPSRQSLSGAWQHLAETVCHFKPTENPAINERSEAGQKARLAALQGLWVVVICCGFDETKQRFFHKASKVLGLNILLLEEPGNHFAELLQQAGDVAHWAPISMAPRTSLVAECLDVIVNFARDRGVAFCGCTTIWDDSVCLCARVAETLELPSNPTHAVDVAHDKLATREFLESNRLPCPKHDLITCAADLEKAAANVGFPAILKPMYGAASIGVLKVPNFESLGSIYKEALELLQQTYAEGDLMGLYFEDAEGVGNSSECMFHMVLEEFLDGQEVDVDIVLVNGQVVYANVVDDWPVRAPWHCEVGNNAPSALSASEQDELRESAAAIITAMGFIMGVFHVEMKYTSNGPRLLEVNPRMGGGPIRDMHLGTFGVDLVEEVFIASVGLYNNPPAKTNMDNEFYVASVQLFPRKSGKLLTCMKEASEEILRNVTGVLEAGPFVEKGATVVAWEDGFPTHLGRVTIRGTTAAGVGKIALSVQEDFNALVDRNIA